MRHCRWRKRYGYRVGEAPNRPGLSLEELRNKACAALHLYNDAFAGTSEGPEPLLLNADETSVGFFMPPMHRHAPDAQATGRSDKGVGPPPILNAVTCI